MQNRALRKRARSERVSSRTMQNPRPGYMTVAGSEPRRGAATSPMVQLDHTQLGVTVFFHEATRRNTKPDSLPF